MTEMSKPRPGRPRIYNDDDKTFMGGEWRKNFKKEWEEATALLRRIYYKQRKMAYPSDSLYI